MKPKFTGHDAFPLRYGWLFKADCFIKQVIVVLGCWARHCRGFALGVGKNMINAMILVGEQQRFNSISEPSLSQG